MRSGMTLRACQLWRPALIRKERCFREKEPRGSSSRVQAVVWSVWWLPSHSEDDAGQGGERQVNYYSEREGWDALQCPLWPAFLSFPAQSGVRKRRCKVASGEAARPGSIGEWTHRSLMTGGVQKHAATPSFRVLTSMSNQVSEGSRRLQCLMM